MSSHKLRALALGAPIAFALAGAAAHATTQINIGVAANFTQTLNGIIAQFQNTYPTGGYTFSVVSDATGNLKAAILSTNPYDIFLAADDTTVPSLPTADRIGSPFNYAIGALALYAGPNNQWNISAGLPALTNGKVTYPIVIADTVKAPYGIAAKELLGHSPWNIPAANITETGDPAANIFTRPNITATYAAVQAGTYKAGFVNLSAICQFYSGAQHFPANTYEHVYPDTTVNPTGGYYSQILQSGTEIQRHQSSAVLTGMSLFVSFLTTNTNAKALITRYCYTLP